MVDRSFKMLWPRLRKKKFLLLATSSHEQTERLIASSLHNKDTAANNVFATQLSLEVNVSPCPAPQEDRHNIKMTKPSINSRQLLAQIQSSILSAVEIACICLCNWHSFNQWAFSKSWRKSRVCLMFPQIPFQKKKRCFSSMVHI